MRDDRFGEALDELAAGPRDARSMARVARSLAGSARRAGALAVTSGRWMADVAIDLAPRIPIRDAETLSRHHDGRTGAELATELIRVATATSAVIGAAAGALVDAEELAPPAWVAIPFELAVETLAVAAVEMKLVAELHEAYGRPVPGRGTERTVALVQAWAERRGVRASAGATGLADLLGRGTRNEVRKLVRRRLMRRMGRNLSSLAPLMAGAVVGAEVNRRATRALGEAVVRDLAESR